MAGFIIADLDRDTDAHRNKKALLNQFTVYGVYKDTKSMVLYLVCDHLEQGMGWHIVESHLHAYCTRIPSSLLQLLFVFYLIDSVSCNQEATDTRSPRGSRLSP